MRFKNVFVLSLVCLLSLVSCSSHKKQVVYSGIAGGLTTAYLSKEASPNKKSEDANMVIGFVVGAAISGLVGHYLYEDSDPTKDLEPLGQDQIIPNRGNVKSLDSLFNNQPLILPNGVSNEKK